MHWSPTRLSRSTPREKPRARTLTRTDSRLNARQEAKGQLRELAFCFGPPVGDRREATPSAGRQCHGGRPVGLFLHGRVQDVADLDGGLVGRLHHELPEALRVGAHLAHEVELLRALLVVLVLPHEEIGARDGLVGVAKTPSSTIAPSAIVQRKRPVSSRNAGQSQAQRPPRSRADVCLAGRKTSAGSREIRMPANAYRHHAI